MNFCTIVYKSLPDYILKAGDKLPSTTRSFPFVLNDVIFQQLASLLPDTLHNDIRNILIHD
jgi:hypothetical protein